MGEFGSFYNTPTVCADDLFTILGIFKRDPKSRSVNKFLQQLDFDPNNIKHFFNQPKPRPGQMFMNQMIMNQKGRADDTAGVNLTMLDRNHRPQAIADGCIIPQAIADGRNDRPQAIADDRINLTPLDRRHKDGLARKCAEIELKEPVAPSRKSVSQCTQDLLDSLRKPAKRRHQCPEDENQAC